MRKKLAQKLKFSGHPTLQAAEFVDVARAFSMLNLDLHTIAGGGAAARENAFHPAFRCMFSLRQGGLDGRWLGRRFQRAIMQRAVMAIVHAIVVVAAGSVFGAHLVDEPLDCHGDRFRHAASIRPDSLTWWKGGSAYLS